LLILIYLLTAIGLPHGGSSAVHIFTQTVQRTTQLTTEQHNYQQNNTINNTNNKINNKNNKLTTEKQN
jgi:hypothetical protein